MNLSGRRGEIVARIIAERERQFNLPGIEYDIRNSPNDWLALIGRYLYEPSRRGAVNPTRNDFEDCLVKAAAIMLAALEHGDTMTQDGKFS